MKYAALIFFTVFTVPGCGDETPAQRSYTPKKMTPEEVELQKELSAYTNQIKTALSQPGDYVQVAVVEKHVTFPEDEYLEGEFTRVLVLHRETLDLDDYGFSLPGKVLSDDEADSVIGFFNEVMFWVDDDANIIFDDYHQPPGTELVVEWCVSSAKGNAVALHFGGIPCLTLDLSQ